MEHIHEDEVPEDGCVKQQAYNNSLRADMELIVSHTEMLRQRISDAHKSYQNLQPLIAILEERLNLAKNFMETLNNRFEGKDNEIRELQCKVKQKREQAEDELHTLSERVSSLEMEASFIEQEYQVEARQLDEAIRRTSECIEEVKSHKEQIDQQLVEYGEKVSSLKKERDEAARRAEKQNNGLQETFVEIERKQQWLHSVMKRGEELQAALSSKFMELEQAMKECENLHQSTFSVEELSGAVMHDALSFNETMKADIESMLAETEIVKRGLRRKVRNLLKKNARSRLQLKVSARSVKELRDSITGLLCQTAEMQACLQEVKRMDDSILVRIEKAKTEVLESQARVEALSRCHEHLDMQRKQNKLENPVLVTELADLVARIASTTESLARERELAQSLHSEREAMEALLREREAAIYGKIKGASKVLKLRQELSIRQLEVTELEERFKNVEASESMEISRLEKEITELREEHEERERQIRHLQQSGSEKMSEVLMNKMAYVQALEKEIDDGSEQLISLRKQVAEMESRIADLSESVELRDSWVILAFMSD